MITPDPALLELMRCPITHSKLKTMSAEQLTSLNQRLSKGTLKDKRGLPIQNESFELAIINEEGSYAYSIQKGIVKLIADEAIDLNSN